MSNYFGPLFPSVAKLIHQPYNNTQSLRSSYHLFNHVIINFFHVLPPLWKR